jgi:hypothetical protein
MRTTNIVKLEVQLSVVAGGGGEVQETKTKDNSRSNWSWPRTKFGNKPHEGLDTKMNWSTNHQMHSHLGLDIKAVQTHTQV